jgi:hypothetical protein
LLIAAQIPRGIVLFALPFLPMFTTLFSPLLVSPRLLMEVVLTPFLCFTCHSDTSGLIGLDVVIFDQSYQGILFMLNRSLAYGAISVLENYL